MRRNLTNSKTFKEVTIDQVPSDKIKDKIQLRFKECIDLSEVVSVYWFSNDWSSYNYSNDFRSVKDNVVEIEKLIEEKFNSDNVDWIQVIIITLNNIINIQKIYKKDN